MIFEKIRQMICEQFFIEAEEITTETAFIKDLDADSLDIVDLVMTIEDEFGIEVSDEEIRQIVTVGDLVDYISRCVKE